MRVFFAVCLITSLAIGAEKPIPPEETKNDWLVKHPTILKLLELHNTERLRVGLEPLKLNTEMCLAAQKHATYMADTGWLVHSGLPYRENIFMSVTSPESATNGWIWSPAHHTNMLSGTEAGFGYQYKNGRPCWVGVFK